MSPLDVTPSQTVGPYFSIGLPWADGPYAAPATHPQLIRIHGQITDGAGAGMPDVLIESWQIDPPQGEGFRGFARAAVDDEGHYELFTLKPGGAGTVSAPHIAISVFGRGMLHRSVTRIYFADEGAANATDTVLGRVPPDRRDTLLAVADEGGYRFDIRLQGREETVFFAI